MRPSNLGILINCVLENAFFVFVQIMGGLGCKRISRAGLMMDTVRRSLWNDSKEASCCWGGVVAFLDDYAEACYIIVMQFKPFYGLSVDSLWSCVAIKCELVPCHTSQDSMLALCSSSSFSFVLRQTS